MISLPKKTKSQPGFNLNTREYNRLDCDAWLVENNIHNEGTKRGAKDLPSSNETLPDEIYNKVQRWINEQALNCKNAVGEYIGHELASLQDIINAWQKENPEITIEAFVAQNCQDLRTKVTKNESDLEKKRKEFKESAEDIKKFRQKNNLSRIADYPDNQFAHWMWIPVLLIIESFVGANLIGSVSQGGIIEGWIIGVGITIANIACGILAGYLWRFKNMKFGFKNILAVGGSMTLFVFSSLWNCIAGHVRDVYVLAEQTGKLETTFEAFKIASESMIEQPLPWDSLNSAGLALIGIIVFLYTAYKSYHADDSFPGYGAKHRKNLSLHKEYLAAHHGILDDLKAARDQANLKLDEYKSKYQLDRGNWENIQDRLRIVMNDYRENLEQYNKDLSYLLAAYRDANLAARQTPQPKFFNTILKIDKEVLSPPPYNLPVTPEWGNITKKIEGGYNDIEATYVELDNYYKSLSSAVDDYTDSA